MSGKRSAEAADDQNWNGGNAPDEDSWEHTEFTFVVIVALFVTNRSGFLFPQNSFEVRIAMGEEDETFEVVESGSSLTYPISAGSLKKGDYVVIKGHPCKIIDVSVSKTGKHGHAKASITALDIFTKQKLEEQSPTTHNLPAPFVKTTNYTLLDIGKDGRLSLMDEESNTREDLNLPEDEELAKELKDLFADGKELVLIVVSAMGKEQVLSYKGSVEK